MTRYRRPRFHVVNGTHWLVVLRMTMWIWLHPRWSRRARLLLMLQASSFHTLRAWSSTVALWVGNSSRTCPSSCSTLPRVSRCNSQDFRGSLRVCLLHYFVNISDAAIETASLNNRFDQLLPSSSSSSSCFLFTLLAHTRYQSCFFSSFWRSVSRSRIQKILQVLCDLCVPPILLLLHVVIFFLISLPVKLLVTGIKQVTWE